MEASLPKTEDATQLPPGVAESDLYDGPAQPTQLQLVRPIAPPAPPPPQVTSGTATEDRYPAAVLLALDVLSARLLGLIALITACLVWAGVVLAPDFWRIVAAGVFSALVFLPIVGLYWRAGLTGDKGGG